MNNYSISTDELASGLQKASSTLSLLGNTIEEAAALITAGNATIQDVDSVASGVKTISLRLVGTEEAQEELEDMGEEIDDWVTKTNSKKREIIMTYTAVASNNGEGVDILDENGNYKTTYEILKEIGEVYAEIQAEDEKYGTNRATALLEEMAGKNRSNILASILQNYEMLEDVYDTASDSAGSADAELEKYLDSIEAKTQKLTTQLQELASVSINTDAYKGLLDIITKLLSGVTSLVDTIGIIPSLLGVGGIAGALKSLVWPKITGDKLHIS